MPEDKKIMFEEHNERLWKRYKRYTNSNRSNRIIIIVWISLIAVGILYNIINEYWDIILIFKGMFLCLLCFLYSKMKKRVPRPFRLLDRTGKMIEAQYSGSMEADLRNFMQSTDIIEKEGEQYLN